ncbi:hypothetical protein ACS72_15385 [Acinetobacter sp. VT 511]|uniref:lipopolysaccharide biosynthesis protein n=1 Tax=Acinetobacter sp. VT 511 TaxID=1675902 RepID=UPI00066233EA|nr:oligosaccharide flippase family protein [Acinetobacter sp. VT 511]KMU98388.1 hypothetical protein ACS72_15385 [Acinetobacter sp. VT 511]
MKNVLDKINTKLNAQEGFLKAVSVLAGGTAFAQVLGILTLPILTRLYTPQEFSVFAIYTALLGTLVVISCLRFEIAIPIPKNDKTAINLLILCLLSNIFLTALLIFCIILFKETIDNIINNKDFIKFIWLVPVGFFLAGLYNTFQFWYTRKKKFKDIAKTRVFQSISSSAVQVLMGILGGGVLGLIIGQIVNYSSGLLKLIKGFNKEKNITVNNISLKDIKLDFEKYDKFPKYSTLEALAHSSSMQLPLVIIGIFFLGPETGYIFLAMKVMTIPMSLIGNAIAQVYLANAPEHYNNKKLFEYSIKIVKKILKISWLPVFLMGVGSYYLFAIIFGKQWAAAGEIAIFLVPWILMQLLSSPIAMALHVIGKQKIAMLLHFFGFVIRVLGLITIGFTISNYMIEYFLLSGFVFYLIYLVFILSVVYRDERELI